MSAMLNQKFQLLRYDRPTLVYNKRSLTFGEQSFHRRYAGAEKRVARNWENLDAIPDCRSRAALGSALICASGNAILMRNWSPT